MKNNFFISSIVLAFLALCVVATSVEAKTHVSFNFGGFFGFPMVREHVVVERHYPCQRPIYVVQQPQVVYVPQHTVIQPQVVYTTPQTYVREVYRY